MFRKTPSYAKVLNDDFEQAGLTGHLDAVVSNYQALYHVVKNTAKLFPIYDIPYSALEPFVPHSDLSTAVLRVIMAKQRHLRGAHCCCSQAEPRLIQNIGRKNVSDATTRSPIIVADAGRPVGIVKTGGEPTCYGLETYEDDGLIAGTFATVPLIRSEEALEGFAPSDHPWSVDVSDIASFNPQRFSTFMVPKDIRAKMATQRDQKPTLRFDHEDIRMRAAELLAQACPIAVPIALGPYTRTVADKAW